MAPSISESLPGTKYFFGRQGAFTPYEALFYNHVPFELVCLAYIKVIRAKFYSSISQTKSLFEISVFYYDRHSGDQRVQILLCS